MKRADPSALRKKKPRPRVIRSYAALVEHLAGGGKVCKTLPRVASDPVIWTDPATDRAISRGLVERAMTEGKLQGCGDGLFVGHDQTFEEARPWSR